MTVDPFRDMTEVERKQWLTIQHGNRAAADRAGTHGNGNFREMIERHQRAAIDRANEAGRENEGGRNR